MTKSIRIYQQFSGKETLLAIWSDLPEFFFSWFSQTFSKDETGAGAGVFDVRNERFTNFLLACAKFSGQRQNNYPIHQFFEFKNKTEIEETNAEAFLRIFYDSSKILFRHLDRNLIWKIKDDTPGEPENRQGMFQGKFFGLRKVSTDGGFGASERWKHDARYYVFAEFNIYGFPVSVDSRLCVDVRDILCKQNGCQRISEKLLSELEQKNKDRRIQALISYKCNDEWPRDLSFSCPRDVIAQLDLTRD